MTDADNGDALVDAPDIDAAISPNCNNGTVDTGEDCDGAAPTDTTCVELGYATGSLGCAANCTYDRTECTAAQPDLVVWYRFEDAQSATSVADSSPTALSLSLSRNGTTTLGVDGMVGNAIDFDGTTGYLDGGAAAALTNLLAVTAEAWVNLDAQTMYPSGPSSAHVDRRERNRSLTTKLAKPAIAPIPAAASTSEPAVPLMATTAPVPNPMMPAWVIACPQSTVPCGLIDWIGSTGGSTITTTSR